MLVMPLPCLWARWSIVSCWRNESAVKPGSPLACRLDVQIWILWLNFRRSSESWNRTLVCQISLKSGKRQVVSKWNKIISWQPCEKEFKNSQQGLHVVVRERHTRYGLKTFSQKNNGFLKLLKAKRPGNLPSYKCIGRDQQQAMQKGSVWGGLDLHLLKASKNMYTVS